MSDFNIEIIADNSEEVLDAICRAMPRALEKCGMQAENYAKIECPVDTGRLRNSITHKVQGDSAYIGTNVEYAAYVEMGHIATNGAHVPAQPYIRPAAEKHADEYKKIIQDELKNA